MLNRGIFAVIALALGALGSQATAQGAGYTTDEPIGTISIGIDEAIVLHFEGSFSETSISNPEIADIATLSDTKIYLLGKALGDVTLTLIDANVNIRSYSVAVRPEIGPLLAFAEAALPEVTFRQSGQLFFADGCRGASPQGDVLNQVLNSLNTMGYEVFSNVGKC